MTDNKNKSIEKALKSLREAMKDYPNNIIIEKPSKAYYMLIEKRMWILKQAKAYFKLHNFTTEKNQ